MAEAMSATLGERPGPDDGGILPERNPRRERRAAVRTAARLALGSNSPSLCLGSWV